MRKLLLNLFLSTVGLLFAGQASAQEEIAPGIIKLQAGEIDTFTPYSLFGGKPAVEAMKQLPAAKPPFSPDEVQIKITDRGCLIEVPLEDNEQIYGFGLQFETFGQRGLRKRPIVNDNPLNGLGYTHAPQTFYVSTKGYGILVNTARYTTFLCGSNQKTEHSRQLQTEERKHIATTTEDLYKNRSNGNKVHIDVPGAKGIEVFIITGPEVLDVVKRYNLLSGGGCLPPMWGLGFKYRVKGDATQDSVMRFANYFREKQIPCDGTRTGMADGHLLLFLSLERRPFPKAQRNAGPVAAERIQSKPVGTRVCSSFFPHPEGAGALLRRFPCMERTGTGLHPAGSTQNIYRLPPHTDRRRHLRLQTGRM